ncbi:phosphotransferase family protein [Amycolatopsis acidiphila]|uniref:Phosphotransferase family protein n=2 Tax=Amycolatopsis acidiphila TaxID=715473 RepID=A0A558AB78_9PSEU|nr:phosphotransferase family protein [Amycolatopsis acidiphila]
MRQGWFVDPREAGGAVRELFLRYSPQPESSAFHALATEAQVIQALHRAGARVPAVHAVHPEREAVLLDRMPGATWFYRIGDPAEQVRVAQDFIRQLSFVHRLGALDIPALGPARSAREHALERIEAIRERASAPDGTMDPLVRLSADWLERHVPDYDGPLVLVQGDTGPGNFLYQDGRVSAVLDWELCHWGDPMDDIAWLSLRTVQDTFTHLPDRLAEYTELTGFPVDPERVWYYRVFAETTMATLRPKETGHAQPHDAGNRLLYTQLHRRLWLEALNVVLGLDLRRPEPPVPAEPEPWHRFYHDALGMLRTVAPRIDDPLAAQWTKGVARLLRYLKETDASGRVEASRERARLSALLGDPVESVAAGRAGLAQAHQRGAVTDEQLLRELWSRVMVEDELMRTASGALHDRGWPPLG